MANNSALADAKSAGTELFDTSEKVFEDIQAEPGEKAYTFMHTVPYEGSVGLVNLLTTTRAAPEGVRHQPGPVRARGADGLRHARLPKGRGRGVPRSHGDQQPAEDAAQRGRAHLRVPVRRGALYGFPEDMLLDGVKPFHPLDVLDSALTAWRQKAFQLNTWTV